MTIMQAINRADSLKPNIYDRETKIHWLSQLDGQIHRGILSRFADAPAAFSGYTPETPPDQPLLVPPPHDGVYLRWLEAQIDLSNGEIDRYNISITLFTAHLDAFSRDYGRTHNPRSAGRFLF